MKIGVLKGYIDWYSYVLACQELHIDYEIIDILASNWLQNLQKANVDGFLSRPPCRFQEWKTIYDERLFFIYKYLNKPLYPNFNSLYIYENKRNMASFLEFYNIPHAKTWVFIDKKEAIQHLKQMDFPVVLKSNIGAGGTEVSIIHSYWNARYKIQKIFGSKEGMFCQGLSSVLWKFGIPFFLTGTAQKHYLLVQEFHKIKWEWRILKIGNSYFGHQKLLKGNKASGSGLVGWIKPPEELLYMAKDICDKGCFEVMDIDIFETIDGEYLVNELQAVFGSYLPYQMCIDGKPGRYVYSDREGFVFEEGEFNRLNSKLLYVQDFVEKMNSGYYNFNE